MPGTIVNVLSMSVHAHRRDRIRINGLNIGWTDTKGEDATSAGSTAPATTGGTRPARRCLWAS